MKTLSIALSLILLVASIYYASQGNYPRATYDLLLAMFSMYWADMK